MSSYWRLSDALTVTIAAGRAIFLDVRRDRYAMLPPATNRALVAWLSVPDLDLPADCRTALERQFGFVPDATVAPQPVTVAPANAVPGVRLPRARYRWTDIIGVARTVIRARRGLDTRPLHVNLDRRRARLAAFAASNGASLDRSLILRRASIFQAARPLAPVPRICLLDALALIDWLAGAAAGAQLIFGVTAYPFGAHCWVQADDMLLGDAPDVVSRYAPILHLGR